MSDPSQESKPKPEKIPATPQPEKQITPGPKPAPVPEVGGQSGPEPTRYGDWEKNGRCTDF
jgi:hypothetical protein